MLVLREIANSTESAKNLSLKILASKCFRVSTSLDISCVTKNTMQAQRKRRTSLMLLYHPSHSRLPFRFFFFFSNRRDSSRFASCKIESREIDYKGKKISPSLTLLPSPYVRRRSKMPENARDYTDIIYGYVFLFFFFLDICFLTCDIPHLPPSLKIYG